jgi:psp operon transcriptional activator
MKQDPELREHHQAIGESEAFLTLQEQISRAARTNRPVILIGERGTGKELAAARLHLLSTRWNQPYATLNCASLTPTLIESELFGHEAGAFTGAIRQRKGRFEWADGGSLFLDEVANIPMTAQEKILRVVEYGQLERVGGQKSIQINVRLISATNVDLLTLAREGQFRQDLLDRLSFEVITLPPLRERVGDIPVLARHFATRMSSEMKYKEAPPIPDEVMLQLVEYEWPGNIRELKNVVERMIYRCGGGPVDEIVFDPFDSAYTPCGPLKGSTPLPDPLHSTEPDVVNGEKQVISMNGNNNRDSMPLNDAVRDYEIHRLQQALKSTRFNQRQAADKLGLTYHQFRGYYRKYHDQLGG